MELRLKEIRKKRGFKSARAFATSIGLQEKTYRNYEQGQRTLTLPIACGLCDALDCSLDDLAGRKRPEVETELIDILRNITPEGQKQLIIYARGIAQTYSKNRQVEKTA